MKARKIITALAVVAISFSALTAVAHESDTCQVRLITKNSFGAIDFDTFTELNLAIQKNDAAALSDLETSNRIALFKKGEKTCFKETVFSWYAEILTKQNQGIAYYVPTEAVYNPTK